MISEWPSYDFLSNHEIHSQKTWSRRSLAIPTLCENIKCAPKLQNSRKHHMLLIFVQDFVWRSYTGSFWNAHPCATEGLGELGCAPNKTTTTPFNKLMLIAKQHTLTFRDNRHNAAKRRAGATAGKSQHITKTDRLQHKTLACGCLRCKLFENNSHCTNFADSVTRHSQQSICLGCYALRSMFWREKNLHGQEKVVSGCSYGGRNLVGKY